jgi:hypothetical protein
MCVNSSVHIYIHTYHSRFIPEGVAEVSQISLRDTHVLPKLLAMRNTADVKGVKPIAVLLQSISGVSAINLLVAFYDIHRGKREVLFFYFVSDTTRDTRRKFINVQNYITITIIHLTTLKISGLLENDKLKKTNVNCQTR